MQIAKILRKEKILTPTAYRARQSGKIFSKDPYFWEHKTISNILERQEYIGNTVNFKTISKNYRSKRRVANDKENQRVFYDTHPAIIDASTFEIVQVLRKNKHRPTATGRFQLFSGKVFCADCGAKLHFCGDSENDNRDYYSCANYRSNTGSCSAHYTRNVTLYNMVFKHIKQMLIYIQQFEESFVRREIEKADKERKISISKAKTEITALRKRDHELNVLFKRMYEDMVIGKLAEDRFELLSAEYEQEKKELKVKITEIQDLIEHGEEGTKDLKRLLSNVRKYTDPKELTPEMLNDLVDKIIVHAPDKSSGHRKQKIEIYYNSVGIIDLPSSYNHTENDQDPTVSKIAV